MASEGGAQTSGPLHILAAQREEIAALRAALAAAEEQRDRAWNAGAAAGVLLAEILSRLPIVAGEESRVYFTTELANRAAPIFAALTGPPEAQAGEGT